MTTDATHSAPLALKEETMKIKLDPGSFAVSKAKEPVIEVTEGAGGTYIWIGNDTEGEQFCFGTLGPRKADLRKLRDALNRVLDG